MSTLYSYPPSNMPHAHDVHRSHEGRFDLDRRHGTAPTSRNSLGHVSMAPPPPRLPVPVDPSLQGVMSNPSTPFPNHVFPVAGTLAGDSARDARGTSSIWLPSPVQSGTETNADPIIRFYNSTASSEPWSQTRVTGVVPVDPSSQGPNKRQRVYGHNLQFGSGTRSDYGVYPGFSRSDSEYSSSMDHAARTAPHHNHAGSPEGVGTGIDELPRINGTTSSVDQGYQTAQPQPQPLYEPRTLSDDAQSQDSSTGLLCERPDCEYVAKCQSEMKKHIARHEKPFKCASSGCARKDKGFSTINDLERHNKCVHGVNPSHGLSKSYKCFGDNCTKKEKEWPRLDNFRQHLSRMHQNQDQETLIKVSERWYESQAQAQRKRQQQHGRFPQQNAPAGAIHRSGPRPDISATSQNGAAPRPAHPDQNQDYLPHKQRSSVSFVLGCETSSAISRSSSMSKTTNPPTSHSIRAQGALMQRQQTGQGIPQEFIELPPQVNGNGTSNMPASVSQRTQQSSRSLPGENDSVMSEGISSLPVNSNIQKSAAWDGLVDTARLTSFMTAAASLGEAELKLLGRSYQDLEVELAHLTGPNNAASHNGRPAVPVSSSFSAKATHAPNLPSEYRIGFENLKALGRFSNMMSKSRSVTAVSDPGLLPADGSRRPPSATSVSGSGGGSATGLKSESRFKCPHCVKEFDKQCLLNKHLGRHNKIYSCISSGCDKRFGSKNDWIRHEESQHPLLTTWLCEVEKEDGRLCGEFITSSGTRNHMLGPSNHLREVHRYESEKEIQAAEEEWKMGRFRPSAFWCGFCTKRVVVERDRFKPIQDQRARFNHIETEHYKKGQKREEWVAADKFASHIRGYAGNYGPTDDDSVSSESSQGTRLSGDTLVPNPATLQSTDPTKAAAATTLQPTTIAPQQLVSERSYVCCKCGEGPWNYSLHRSCGTCQHHACKYCSSIDDDAGVDR